MALLTSQKNTPLLSDPSLYVYPVEAGVKIYLGAMVGIDDNGYALPAQPLTGSSPLTNPVRVMGRAERVHNGIPGQDADNSSGAAGAISLVVRRAVMKYDNHGDITIAAIGKPCFAADDHTVGIADHYTGSTQLLGVAGRIMQVDSDGVWVDFREQSALAA